MTKRLRRNFGFMGAAVLGVALLQYALYFVVARYLGTAHYGQFAIALTMAMLAAPLCDLGMNVSVVWSHSRHRTPLSRLIGASLLCRAGLAPIVGTGTLAIGWLLGFDSITLTLFVPLFLAAIFDGVAGLFSAAFQAQEKMGGSSAILLSRNVARVLGFGGTLAVGGDVASLAWFWLTASVVSAGGSAWFARCHVKVEFDRAAVRPMLRDALPFGSAIVANLMLLQSDIVMVGFFAGDAEVGLYHAAFRFVVLAELLPQIVSTVVMPQSYRMGHMEGPARLSRFFRVQILMLGTLGVLGSLLLALHGDLLVSLALGPDFVGSGAVLIALAPLVLLRFLCVPLGDALSSLGGQRQLSHAAWFACAANIALNLWLVPRSGALGAALATCCSQACMALALTFLAGLRGLRPDSARILRHAILAAVAVAILSSIPAVPDAVLLPAAVLIVLVLFRHAPTPEHASLLRLVPPLGPLLTRSAR